MVRKVGQIVSLSASIAVGLAAGGCKKTDSAQGAGGHLREAVGVPKKPVAGRSRKVVDTKTLDALIHDLDSTDKELQTKSAAELGGLGDERAVVALSKLLKNATAFDPSSLRGVFMLADSKAVRVIQGKQTLPDLAGTAAIALGRIGGDGLNVLAATLKSPEAWFRRSAARGLGFEKSRQSVELLIGALEDTDSLVRDGALEELKNITDQKLGPDVSKWKEYLSHAEALR